MTAAGRFVRRLMLHGIKREGRSHKNIFMLNLWLLQFVCLFFTSSKFHLDQMTKRCVMFCIFARIRVFKKGILLSPNPFNHLQKIVWKEFFADYIEYGAFESWINCIWLMCYSCRSTEVWSKRLIFTPLQLLKLKMKRSMLKSFYYYYYYYWSEMNWWASEAPSFFYSHSFLISVQGHRLLKTDEVVHWWFWKHTHTHTHQHTRAI